MFTELKGLKYPLYKYIIINFYPFEFVSHYHDPQLLSLVSKKYSGGDIFVYRRIPVFWKKSDFLDTFKTTFWCFPDSKI